MIEYVEARATDVPLVIHSWLTSYRDSYSAGIVAMRDWFKVMTPQIQGILSRPGVELYVATNPDADPDLKIDCHGWIAVERGFRVSVREHKGGRWRKRLTVSETPLVHFVFVKSLYRNQGVARGLFEIAQIDPLEPFYYTCRTRHAAQLSKKVPCAEWDPMIARWPRKDEQHEANTSGIHPIQGSDAGGAGDPELKRE